MLNEDDAVVSTALGRHLLSAAWPELAVRGLTASGQVIANADIGSRYQIPLTTRTSNPTSHGEKRSEAHRGEGDHKHLGA